MLSGDSMNISTALVLNSLGTFSRGQSLKFTLHGQSGRPKTGNRILFINSLIGTPIATLEVTRFAFKELSGGTVIHGILINLQFLIDSFYNLLKIG